MVDYNKPVAMATLGELKELLEEVVCNAPQEVTPEKKKTFVYGIAGIAALFGCSIPTAQRIKNSGVIDDAISQYGRIICVDSDYAIDLLKVDPKWRTTIGKRLPKKRA